MTPLVLASTSIYRKELVAKLGLPFETKPPACDESWFKTRISDPIELAATLAFEKAKSLADPQNCVIGGDQVVALGQEILGKPGNFKAACEQLEKMQGRSHRLITALHVVHQGKSHAILDLTELCMRSLTSLQIENYVFQDQPFDCAASYKIEKTGILLFTSIICQDFTAIQGVPLIQLANLLTQLGYPFFKVDSKELR